LKVLLGQLVDVQSFTEIARRDLDRHAIDQDFAVVDRVDVQPRIGRTDALDVVAARRDAQRVLELRQCQRERALRRCALNAALGRENADGAPLPRFERELRRHRRDRDDEPQSGNQGNPAPVLHHWPGLLKFALHGLPIVNIIGTPSSGDAVESVECSVNRTAIGAIVAVSVDGNHFPVRESR